MTKLITFLGVSEVWERPTRPPRPNFPYKRKTEFRFMTWKEMWEDIKLWWQWFLSKW